MTFGDNGVYIDNIFHLTDFIISINYFAYILTLAVLKRIVLKGMFNNIECIIQIPKYSLCGVN
jgi:hypothetical protein